MLIAYWPLIIAIVGVLVWALASNAKAQKIGEWMFVIGFFWFTFSLVGKTLRLFP